MSNIRDQYKLYQDKDGGKNWYVMITEGLYTGLVYRYIKFQISKEENPDGTKHFRFESENIHIPKHLVDVPLPDSEEENLANLKGAILIDVLEKHFETPDPDAEEIELV